MRSSPAAHSVRVASLSADLATPALPSSLSDEVLQGEAAATKRDLSILNQHYKRSKSSGWN